MNIIKDRITNLYRSNQIGDSQLEVYLAKGLLTAEDIERIKEVTPS